MERPRILLVPSMTEIEWVIRPLLEAWADVAGYDAPGVGDEPPVEAFDTVAIARRGLEEVKRRGWSECIVVADEFALPAATHMAAIAPNLVQAMALGHARLSNRLTGDRAPLNREVYAGCRSLIGAEFRTFVRQMFRMTGGERMEGGYGEGIAEEYRRRVPTELMLSFWDSHPDEGNHMGETLHALDVPLLLAQHKGCLLYTDEGFADAVAALPGATVARFDEKPSTSPEFARVLEAFCRAQLTVTA